MICARASARRPGPELAGVAYCPDVLDPVACDVEREHRYGDAVLLSHQAGWPLTVRSRNVTFLGARLAISTQARAICSPPSMGRRKVVARPPPSAIAVAAGYQGVDVLGFPCRLEGPAHAGLLGCRGRGRLRRAEAAAGWGGQLAARRRRAAADLGHLGEGVAEDIVQDECDAVPVATSQITRRVQGR
jgi:hypothetical protein